MKRPFISILMWLIVITTIALSCKPKTIEPEPIPPTPITPTPEIPPTNSIPIENCLTIGSNNSFIIQPDNTLWAAGYNFNGEAGTFVPAVNNQFKIIAGNIKTVVSGGNHSFIIKTDNSLWATGDNDNGQLGDGTTVRKYSFVKITDDVKKVVTGEFIHYLNSTGYEQLDYSLIIKTDNSLWACGNNLYGQFGDGTTTDKLSFTKIADDVQDVSTGVGCSFMI